jgi:hypothetical protein
MSPRRGFAGLAHEAARARGRCRWARQSFLIPARQERARIRRIVEGLQDPAPSQNIAVERVLPVAAPRWLRPALYAKAATAALRAVKRLEEMEGYAGRRA